MSQISHFSGLPFGGDAASVSLNLAIGVMLGTAWLSRRSLGSLPPWMATFVYAVSVELLWTFEGLPSGYVLGSFGNMIMTPTILMFLARLQCIPGLRRGEWTSAQRRQFILQRAFAANWQFG